MIDTLGYDTARPVYLPDPVNRHYPLNRGRTAWLLGLPGLDGGQYWYDLMGLSPGTLTSMGNSSNGWRSDGPAGLGSLLFDGSAGYVDVGTPPALEVYSAFSVFASIKTTATSGFVVTKDFSTGNRGWVLGVSASKLYVEWLGSPLESGLSPNINDGLWHRIGFSWNGVNLRVYIDGANNWEGAWTPPSMFTNSSAHVNIGRRAYVGFPTYFTGRIADVAFWNRGLSDAEAKTENDLSRAGYPGALNRIPASIAGAAAAAVVSRIRALNHLSPGAFARRAS